MARASRVSTSPYCVVTFISRSETAARASLPSILRALMRSMIRASMELCSSIVLASTSSRVSTVVLVMTLPHRHRSALLLVWPFSVVQFHAEVKSDARQRRLKVVETGAPKAGDSQHFFFGHLH